MLDAAPAGGKRIHFFLKNKFIYLFIYFWLCWVFVSVRGLSPVAASGGHSSLQCAGLSLSRPLLLQSTGSRRAGSAVVAHGPSRSAACGILPDQGSNPCPPHWQADSQPLRHQGSPRIHFKEARAPDSTFLGGSVNCQGLGTRGLAFQLPGWMCGKGLLPRKVLTMVDSPVTARGAHAGG